MRENDELAPVKLTGEERFELSLRPKRLEEFIGQDKLKQNLRIFLKAAQQRGEPLDHLLLFGPPGLGKTTVANIVAQEMETVIHITSGPAIIRTGDLVGILTNLEPGAVLFIDEIHRLSRQVEEILYPAMEDLQVDVMIGQGPAARSIRLPVPHFTVIGATTRQGLLTGPLRDRFGIVCHFQFYEREALFEIIKRSSGILGYAIDPSGAMEIVDEMGLDRVDRTILETILLKYGGGPVGLETLAASIGEDAGTIEDVYEPYLLQLGLIGRTPRGRVTTDQAARHLGIEPPDRSGTSET